MKLPTRLSVLSYACALCALGLSLFIFWQSAANQIKLLQTTHQAAIAQLLNNHFTGDPRILTRQLSSSFKLPYLQVSQLDGAILHEQSTPETAIAYAQFALGLFDVSLAPIRLADPLHNLQVDFSPPLQSQLRQLQVHSLLLCTGCTLLVLLPFFHFRAQVRLKTKHSLHPVEKLSAQTLQAAHLQTPSSAPVPSSTDYFVELALVDQLTGLANKQQFIRHYETSLKAANAAQLCAFGVLRLENLSTLSQQQGYLATDVYIKEIAERLKQLPSEFSLSRLNHTDFCFYSANATELQAQELSDSLLEVAKLYAEEKQTSHPLALAVLVLQQGMQLSELLLLADNALNQAQKQATDPALSHIRWCKQGQSHQAQASASPLNWPEVLDGLITHQRFSLLSQYIQPLSKNQKGYSELLVRFKNQDEQLLPTNLVLAMAEKLARLLELEPLIVEQALELANKHPNEVFGINLSDASVQDETFVRWLQKRLQQEPALCRRLVFEVSEEGLLRTGQSAKQLLNLLQQLGAKVTVEHFGLGSASLKFFRELKPDFIKLDASYTHDIEEDKNNQYFVSLLVDLAHRLDIAVLAEDVESEAEKQMLETLSVDGLQGYYLSKPVVLE